METDCCGAILLTQLQEHLAKSAWAGMFSIECGEDGIVLLRNPQCRMREYETAANAFIEDATGIITENGYKPPLMRGSDRNSDDDFVLRFVRA